MRVVLVLTITTLAACATYQGKVNHARSLIQDGRLTEALTTLKPLADTPSKDQLVYLLDFATALQVAGDFNESNKYFIQADKLADIQDYTSLSLESGAFVLGEEMVQYKGDDFEIILINAMTAINYLNLGDTENAMVEVRRLNEKLRRFRLEAKRKFTDNALALYLSAIIYEASQSWDDAAIAYEQVYQIAPNYPPLREDLIRINGKARRITAMKKWKMQFPEVVEKPFWTNNKTGEIIVIYQQGWGPRKNFRYDNQRYPAMYPVWSSLTSILPELVPLSPSGTLLEPQFRGNDLLFDVEKVAISSLENQYLSLIARRVGGAIVKEVVAQQIRKENELLGELALLAMHAADRADLRQWSTLPKTFKIYRMTLTPGDYQLKINGAEKIARLTVRPGGKVFVSHRTFQ